MLLFIISFVGLFIPVIPSVISIWLGFLLYHFIINDEKLSIYFWIFMSILTIILFVADFLVNKFFVGKFGGSKWSEWGAVVGLIIGLFVLLPYGILIVPFVLVFFIEIIQAKTFKQAILAAIGSLIGFFSSTAAKVIIQFWMILLFIILVILF